MNFVRRTKRDPVGDQLNLEKKDEDFPRMVPERSSPPFVAPRILRLQSYEYDQNIQQFLSDKKEKEDDVGVERFSDCLRLGDDSDLQPLGSHQLEEENYFSKNRGLKQVQKQKTSGLVRKYKIKYESDWAHDNKQDGNHNLNPNAMNIEEKYPRHEQNMGGRFSSSRQASLLHCNLLPRDFNAELSTGGTNAESSLLSPEFSREKSFFSGFRNGMESPLLPGNFSPEFCDVATNTGSLSHHTDVNVDFSRVFRNTGSCSSWTFESPGISGGGAIPKTKKGKSHRRDSLVTPFPSSPYAEQLVFFGETAQIDLGSETRYRSDVS